MYKVYIKNDEVDIIDFVQMINKYTIIKENEIWIFDDSKKYPCLSLLLNNDYVAVHYFRDDSDVGSISINEDTLVSNEFVEFNDICLDKKYIINRNKAVECIYQFVVDGKRPSCIDWFDL